MRVEELERGSGGTRGQVVHAHGELLQVRHARVHLAHQRAQRQRAAARRPATAARATQRARQLVPLSAAGTILAINSFIRLYFLFYFSTV